MIQQIKEKARENIKEKVLFLFLVAVFPGLVSAILSPVFPIAFILTILLVFGIKNVFIKVSKNQKADYKDIVIAFNSKDLKRYLVAGFWVILWVFLYSLLLIVPGIIKAYEYSQVFYIANENPELKPKEILEESSKMMKGNKLNLFLLQLSFIGWALLSALTLGIVGIYVLPYYEMSLAEFHKAIK